MDAIKRWDILQKSQLEYMKTELEIMLGDKNVEPDLQSDLTDTDEEEEGVERMEMKRMEICHYLRQ